jgi:DNA-binding GntR family transcriptional regulator
MYSIWRKQGPYMTAKAADRLRDSIENAILTGEFAPGERLDEVSLAARFGVSRTPLREALGQLSAAGLVESRPHRGTFVRTLGADRLVEMFEVMGELEAACARLAARRRTPEQEAALLAAHEACRLAAARRDPDAYYYENERFHFALYAAARNAFLAEEAGRLHRRLKPYRRLQLRAGNRVATSLAEHQGIVDAVAAGQADTAAERARAHVTIQGERFGDFVASLSQMRLAGE